MEEDRLRIAHITDLHIRKSYAGNPMEAIFQKGENPEKKEYLLPNIVAELLEKNLSSVKVLNTSDRWIGITYKEDIEPAQEKFHLMIEDGTYPKELWT